MIRASNLLRLQRCPGSHRLEAQAPPEEDSPQSREGSLLHGYSQNPKLDWGFLKPNQRDLLRIATECRQHIFEKACHYLQIPINLDDWESGNEMLLWEDGIPGHCDWWYLNRQQSALIIVDEKYGYKVVSPASSNLQLRAYAVGAHRKWTEISDIFVAISQPRLPYSERVTMSIYKGEDFEPAEEELLEVVFEAEKPDAPLNPGEEQCRYCTAKLICPAYQKVLARVDFQPAGFANGSLTKRQADAQELLTACTDEQLEAILQAISFSDFIKDQARDEARLRKTSDHSRLPNYSLGKSSDVKKISDAGRAASLLALRGALTREDAFDCAELYLGRLEEKIREKTNCTWKEAKDLLEQTLAPVLERTNKKAPLTRNNKGTQ